MSGTEKVFSSYQCPVLYIGSLVWAKVSHQPSTEFHVYCGNVIYDAGTREV
jgi:hypothetical protein